MSMKPPFYTELNHGHRLSQGIVGNWLFNEAPPPLGSVMDISLNGNHGRLVSDTHSVPGKFGPALDFDGASDKVDCGQNVGTLGASALTMMAWVKLNSIPAGGADQFHIMGRWALNPDRVISARIFDGNTARLVTSDSNSSNSPSDVTINNLITGIWYQMVWVYDGNGGNFYLNGVNQGSFTGLETPLNTASSANFTLGADSVNFGDFNGKMDNATIWNRALSAGEIKELYRDPFQMFKRNL